MPLLTRTLPRKGVSVVKLKYDREPLIYFAGAIAAFTLGVTTGALKPDDFQLAGFALAPVFVSGFLAGTTSVIRSDGWFVSVIWFASWTSFTFSFGFDIGSFTKDPMSLMAVFVAGGIVNAFVWFALGGVAGAWLTGKSRKLLWR